jgi:predicted ester cyclase
MMELWEPGGIGHIHGVVRLRAPESYSKWFSSLFAAFPDFVFTVVDVVADDERAAVRWRATGTFNGTGRFEGMVPTGASIEVEGCDILTIRDGKLVSLEAYLNGAELARQLGALPPQGSAADRGMIGLLNLKTKVVGALRRTQPHVEDTHGGLRGPGGTKH